MNIYIYIYTYCCSGSSSGAPTSPVGGAQARGAADWAGRDASAATAAAATVCCFL